MELKAGIKGYCEVEVVRENTAAALGSGLLEVFATPAMIALMEQTACQSVLPYLDEGMGTVGTRLEISHDAPTPIGMKVRCESTLTEVSGRKLVFEVEAFDDMERVGHGRHERFIINSEKFRVKAEGKGKA